jgi:hypothetical protein
VGLMAPYCSGMECPVSSSPPNSSRAPAHSKHGSLRPWTEQTHAAGVQEV